MVYQIDMTIRAFLKPTRYSALHWGQNIAIPQFSGRGDNAGKHIVTFGVIVLYSSSSLLAPSGEKMTPEELNRTMEFIIEHQAKTSANLDQISEDFVKFEKWAKTILARLAANHQRMANLITIQSSRLDRAEAEDRAAQRRHEALIKEMRAGFDRVLERLPGA